MFYIKDEGKIVLFDTDKEKLINTLAFMPQYQDLEIKKTNRPIIDFQFADTKEYKEKKQKAERERLDKLSLTAADVERAIYKAKGMDFEDILECVSRCQNGEAPNSNIGTTQAPCDEVTQKLCMDIDLKALKIELKANNFYRGNPYINQIGALLGFNSTQLDEFFKSGDYEKLLQVEEPKEEVTDEVTEPKETVEETNGEKLSPVENLENVTDEEEVK